MPGGPKAHPPADRSPTPWSPASEDPQCWLRRGRRSGRARAKSAVAPKMTAARTGFPPPRWQRGSTLHPGVGELFSLARRGDSPRRRIVLARPPRSPPSSDETQRVERATSRGGLPPSTPLLPPAQPLPTGGYPRLCPARAAAPEPVVRQWPRPSEAAVRRPGQTARHLRHGDGRERVAQKRKSRPAGTRGRDESVSAPSGRGGDPLGLTIPAGTRAFPLRPAGGRDLPWFDNCTKDDIVCAQLRKTER